MSVVEMRCPRCGSVCSQKGDKPNEYSCTHCGATFRFVDTSQRYVTTDVLIRNCAFCGKPLETGKGFRCTRCGREYFCDSCVDEIYGKYVCVDCIQKSSQNCQLCRKYGVYKCISCGRKACKQHAQHMRFIQPGSEQRVLFCSRCSGFVCYSCVKFGFFSSTPTCPRCGSALTYYSPY